MATIHNMSAVRQPSKHASHAHGRDRLLTVEYARTALEKITALDLPADPATFEIWYSYASGSNPGLNQALNRIIALKGTIGVEDLEQVYDQYFSSAGFAERVDAVGTRVADVTAQIATLIEAGLGSTGRYKERLAGATNNLRHVKDRDSVHVVIESLVSATREVEQENLQLQNRLNASTQEIRELQTNLDTVRTESRTDVLTKIANRKHFDEALAHTIAHSEDTGKPFSLLMIDIDHFKKFNDSFGHTTGDQVFQLIAAVLKQAVRGQDIPARYGGEEFAVILPNTALQQAASVAENIRNAIIGKELVRRSTGERLGRITVSAGAAEFRRNESSQSLIERADRCLYTAKEEGRNRVFADANVVRAPHTLECSHRETGNVC